MLEVYPEIIAQLNIEAFSHILGTLDFGFHHQVNCDSFLKKKVNVAVNLPCRIALWFYTDARKTVTPDI